MTEHVVGTPDDFPEGEGTEIRVDGVPIAVFNLGGEMYAVSGVCPHKGAPLALAGRQKQPPERFPDRDAVRGGIDEAERSVSCPWHGLGFDLETGDCPAASYRIRAYDVTSEDGQVMITL